MSVSNKTPVASKWYWCGREENYEFDISSLHLKMKSSLSIEQIK